MKINYVEGDLFQLLPQTESHILIPHIVNNIRRWGSGFVVPLGAKWPEAERRYHSTPNLELGSVEFVEVEPETGNNGSIIVCNMVGQTGVVGAGNPKPIKYKALIQAMDAVARTAEALDKRGVFQTNVQIHAPKFGSGLAQGSWPVIEELIQELWNKWPVTIYSL